MGDSYSCLTLLLLHFSKLVYRHTTCHCVVLRDTTGNNCSDIITSYLQVWRPRWELPQSARGSGQVGELILALRNHLLELCPPTITFYRCCTHCKLTTRWRMLHMYHSTLPSVLLIECVLLVENLPFKLHSNFHVLAHQL